jgi:hypothetical protein
MVPLDGGAMAKYPAPQIASTPIPIGYAQLGGPDA